MDEALIWLGGKGNLKWIFNEIVRHFGYQLNFKFQSNNNIVNYSFKL